MTAYEIGTATMQLETICTSKTHSLSLHFAEITTAAQTPSNTASQHLYAEAASTNSDIRYFDVQIAYMVAHADRRYQILMPQPK